MNTRSHSIFVSSLISFISVLYFSNLYWYFLQFIPKHFILFGGIVNDTALLVSFAEVSFLSMIYYWFLYVDFVSCNLTEFISSNLFCVCAVFRFFYITEHLICKQGQFYSFLYNLRSFCFFFCLGRLCWIEVSRVVIWS